MNFIADENIDDDIVLELRQRGYEIISISENFPGISDEQVLEITNKHHGILITGDKDFGDLVFLMGKSVRGVVLIRLFGIPQFEKVKTIVDTFKQYANQFEDSFTVIQKNKIRIKNIRL